MNQKLLNETLDALIMGANVCHDGIVKFSETIRQHPDWSKNRRLLDGLADVKEDVLSVMIDLRALKTDGEGDAGNE